MGSSLVSITPQRTAAALRITIAEATHRLRLAAVRTRAEVIAAERGISVMQASRDLHAEDVEVEVAVTYIEQKKSELAAATVRPVMMSAPPEPQAAPVVRKGLKLVPHPTRPGTNRWVRA